MIRLFYISVFLISISSHSQIIETVAGTGTSGYTGNGGPALSANLNEPWDIDVDSQGNVYFSEHINSVVRKVDAQTGVISNIFGNGTTGIGTSGEPGPEFELTTPGFIHLDETNNFLYVADYGMNKILKMNLSDSTVSTVAGTGVAGYTMDGNTAVSSPIDLPMGISIGTDGLLYFCEANNFIIRRIEANGNLFTVAGSGSQFLQDGPVTSASFEYPYGLEIDSQNNIFVMEVSGSQLRKIDQGLGIVTTVAGSGSATFIQDGLPPLGSSFFAPHAFAIEPGGNVIIGDQGNQRLRYVDFGANTVYTIAGTGTSGYSGDGGDPTMAQVFGPFGVDIGDDGSIYFTEIDNFIVRKISTCFDSSIPQIAVLFATSGTDSLYCAGSVILTVSNGDLNDASDWAWYENGCGVGSTLISGGGTLPYDLQSDVEIFVRGEGGCVTDAPCNSIILNVGDCLDEAETNAFSPNNDGVNDIFYINEADIHLSNHVVIFNRWGDQVKEFYNYNNDDIAWDGRDDLNRAVNGGTYFFIFESDGIQLKGWVNVIK